MSPPPSITSTSAPSYPLSHQASSGYNPGRKLWESWPEAVRVLARGRARGIFPGPNPSEPQVGVLARSGVRGKILLAGVC